MIDKQISASIQQENPYEISIKKFPTEFTETKDHKAILRILVKQTYDCQVQFTETNFTAIFHTKFENF